MTTLQQIKQLNENQIKSFDVEYINGDKWHLIKNTIYSYFPDEKFNFLDIGGGNGLFTDRILRTFPLSTGVLIDNSKLLLEKNTFNERKTLIYTSVESLEEVFVKKKFDIIFINWVLHHLVNKSYIKTHQNIGNTLVSAKRLLSSKGYLSIFENIYNGIFFANLPSYLIFQLTSSQLISPIIKYLGANTAGCGVCFLSKNQWEYLINKAGFQVLNYTDSQEKDISSIQKLILHIGNAREGHFWCSPLGKE